MKSVSMNDASCAIFAAPPLSWPSVLTIRSAASWCWPRAPLKPAEPTAAPTAAVRRTLPVRSLSGSCAMDEQDRSRHTVDELLAQARARIHRRTPDEAQRSGAQIIDIRGSALRERDGEIPGALWFERNVLEWRVDPASDAHDPRVARLDEEVLLICHEGYQSSLAAAVLRDLGFSRAGDVEGGFSAWRAAGLPTTPSPDGARR